MTSANTQKERLTADLPTTSAKIRALHSAGYSRSEIAGFLGIRYQHVRNVLVHEEARQAKASAASLVPKDEPESVRTTKVRIGPDGRIVVPASFRETLGIKEGDTLFASLDDGEIHLLTIPAAVRRAQALVRRYVPEGVSLVDELLAERRREAEGEDRDG
jgi:AbrB family looped-hinge helix DNA binding protein